MNRSGSVAAGRDLCICTMVDASLPVKVCHRRGVTLYDVIKSDSMVNTGQTLAFNHHHIHHHQSFVPEACRNRQHRLKVLAIASVHNNHVLIHVKI